MCARWDRDQFKQSFIKSIWVFIDNMTNYRNGGTITLLESTVTLKNTKIHRNMAEHPVKNIDLASTSHLILDGATFDDDKSVHSAYSIAESTGGYIYSSNSKITSTGAIFKNGIARQGAAIYAVVSEIALTSTTFQANTASDSGGGLYAVNSRSFQINDIQCVDNTAKDAECIYVHTASAPVTITGGNIRASFSPALIRLFQVDAVITGLT